MVEVTKNHERDMVDTIRNFSDIDDKKVAPANDIVERQLAYFKICKKKIDFNQHSLCFVDNGPALHFHWKIICILKYCKPRAQAYIRR